MIKLTKPNVSVEDFKNLKNVLKSSWIVEGTINSKLEQTISRIFNSKFCHTANSWTSAAFLLFKILNLKKNDEVLLPAFTFVACANVVNLCGAKIRFVDTEKDGVNICFDDFKKKYNKNVKAAIIVDQIGIPVEIEKFIKFCKLKKITLIHDVACSFGSLYKKRQSGINSQISITSFHARKPITSAEGGAIILNDKEISNKFKSLKNQGVNQKSFDRVKSNFRQKEMFTDVGFNMRFSDIQASLLINQIQRLKKVIKKKYKILEYYKKYLNFKNFKFPKISKDATPNLQSVLIIFTEVRMRNMAYKKLLSKRIEVKKSISSCFNHEFYFKKAKVLKNSFSIDQKSLLIPMHLDLKQKDIKKICKILNSIN
jgi:dTDP-4-amino-4,6-dideoxygalactose transaminase